AGQRLAIRLITNMINIADEQDYKDTLQFYSDAFNKLLHNTESDKNLIAEALLLPKESYLSGFFNPVNPIAIHNSRRSLMKRLAEIHQNDLWDLYQNLLQPDYKIDSTSIGKRSLRNVCLNYLVTLGTEEAIEAAYEQFKKSNNMTDVMAALGSLVNIDCPERVKALAAFYDKWKKDILVVDKWLSLQALSRLPDTLDHVKKLKKHEAFNMQNPNKVRSLIGAFCHGNLAGFHQANGEGYHFLAQNVLSLDELNPQIAARLLSPLTQWRRYDSARQAQMKEQLKRVLKQKNLSKNVYEIAEKGLV
ncbi:MAG: aminopeptidase N C-terminal domain-containing protein, partial [Candidatus Scalindua sp.]